MSKQEVAQNLNQLLCDYAVYYQKLRNYHWNVKGQRFFQLHEEFEKLYDQASTFVDDIAERIAGLQVRPHSTMAEFVEGARLDEDKSTPNADTMVRNLVNDIETLEGYTAKVIEQGDEAGDYATTNMLEDIVEQQAENAWMLRSWLHER